MKWDKELAVILRRVAYKENHYLLDVYFKDFGLHRATARITKTKHYRQTENLALFQELQISGAKKNDLGKIWQSEVQNNHQPAAPFFFNACYLNELLLNYGGSFQDSEQLYQQYLQSLKIPDRWHLRQMEWLLISHYAMLPECGQLEANYYQLQRVGDGLQLQSADSGYQRQYLQALYANQPDFLHNHSQLFFQALLNHYQRLPNKSRKINAQIRQLTAE